MGRSSRERSLGRDLSRSDLEPILDVERRISNRRDRNDSLSRPSLASHGRSLTQSELGSSASSSGRRLSSGLRSPLTLQDEDYLSSKLPSASKYSSQLPSASKYSSAATTLDDRNRADWRRTSVPERGKDYKSLSKKYNRYSSVIEDSGSGGSGNHYLATTSTSTTVIPQYLTNSCYRSNSHNRVLSPTFDNYTISRRPERIRHEPAALASSGSSSSLRLDNFVTLRRRSLNYPPPASATSSPMVLSPSATRQFIPPLSREGSATPRFSHSCSNASLNLSEAE